MKLHLKSYLFVFIAASTGLIVLLGYFVELSPLVSLRIELMRLAVILTGVALIVGIINLISVHWRKIRNHQTGRFYSLVLLFSLFFSLLVFGYFGPTDEWSLWIFNYVQMPIEMSLMAVLAIILAYACARLLYQRVNIFTLIFVGTTFVVLVGMVSLPWFAIPGLSGLRSWITQVWAVGGARGILLGVALGAVSTGLRILLGTERPYGN